MILDVPYEYQISYSRKRSGVPKTARVRASAPVEISAAVEVEHAASIRHGIETHHWVVSDGVLYRMDALTIDERIADAGFVGPLPLVPSSTLHEDDIGAVLQATRVLTSDQEDAERRVGAIASSLRVHNGRLLYPSRGPVLCIEPVPTPGRAQQKDYVIAPVEGYEFEPASYPGRSFAARDMLVASEFASALDYQIQEVPTVSIRNGHLIETEFRGRPLIDAAARIFDATHLNRAMSNLPYLYVDAYIRYHAAGFDRESVHDELVELLLQVVRNPGATDYYNDVRKRFLDMLDDLHFALWRHLGCGIDEVLDPPDPHASFTMHG